MDKFRNKKRGVAISILLCLCAVFLAITTFFSTQISTVYAYDSSNLPSGDNVIANIYDEDRDKFSEENLNALAKKANPSYADINALIKDVEDNRKIITSSDFGEIIVYFGKSNSGAGSELAWIPAYISNSDEGPILTLWLANTANSNEGSNQQEISGWTDNTFCNNVAPNPSSNNYSTSYMRALINNGGVYYGGYNNTTHTDPTEKTLVASNTNKFAIYTTGVLASYITAPSAVGWQKNANKTKNDPEWTGNSNGHYTPKDWLNDKLWMPSLYEVYDNTLTENSTATSFTNNGGLWGISTTELSNITYSWLRSGHPTLYYRSFTLISGGKFDLGTVSGSRGLRPALHLNLRKVKNNIKPEHVHNFGAWVVTTRATCTTKGEQQRVCTSADCPLAGGVEKKEISIDPSAHSWGSWTETKAPTCLVAGEETRVCAHNPDHTETRAKAVLKHIWDTAWNKDGTNHWHDCTRGCGTKNGNAAHSFSWVVDTPATVTTAGIKHEECICGERRSENTVIPIETCPHTNKTHVAAVAATCMTAGNVEYWHCNVCNKDIDSGGAEITDTVIPIDPSAHSFVNYNSNNDATCLADGTKTAVCAHGCGTRDTIADAGSMLPHVWATVWSKDGTNHWHECTLGCGTKNDDAAHSFSWVVDTPATVTTAGIKHEECICGERRSENTVIPIETCPHTNKTHVAAVAATCMTAGNVEYWHCNDCNKNLDASNLELTTVVIPIDPSAHNWGAWVETVAPTYDADGEERRECQNAGCTHFETRVIPKKAKVQITVTINPASSEVGAALETLTATVTSGTLINPADVPYTLSTNADINTMGTYTITGICTDSRYDITFIDGVYIVSKKADDPNGGGSVDLPKDIDVEFKVTQSETDNNYKLDGLKVGYWAQLWYRNADGTLGDEFTDTMNCILTLKIPTEIIEAIRGTDKIDREKIAAGLGVYYVDGDGELVAVDNFRIAQKEDESWIIKFNYNAKFAAEIVFNAPDYKGQQAAASGIPWWVWLIVGLAGAAVVGVVVVIVITVKKRASAR